jgi:hypothetical protein
VASPIIPNVYRCALNWKTAGPAYAENVIHILCPGTSASHIMEILEVAVGNQMWASVSDEARVESVSITPLTATPLTEEFPTVSASWTPDTGGEYIPQMAGIVKLLSSTGGRRARGRVFLPFTRESAQEGGALATTVADGLSDAWNDFKDAIVTADGNAHLVVASYRGLTSHNVVNCIGEKQTGTQRRRQGRNR